MLWFNGKDVFFRVQNFFNFALWINKIRSPASYMRKLLCLFCREKFCKKTVYSGIELICEFSKIWLMITKTCLDSFFVVSARLATLQKFLKGSLTGTSSSFQVQHAHFQVRVGVFSCQQIVKKICFVFFCAEILQHFSLTFAKRLLTSWVFLSDSETLHYENKIDKEFWLNRIKSLFEFIKSVIVPFLIISAVFTYFQLSF